MPLKHRKKYNYFLKILLILLSFTMVKNDLLANNSSILKEPSRLPKTIKPSNYTLHFTPNLPQKTFKGEESINVELLQPSKYITLHSKDLTINSISVHFNNKKLVPKITKDDLRQWIRLDFSEMIPKGKVIIKTSFEGKFSEEPIGFFLNENDGTPYSGTMLENIYARRMFPCFDEPAMKAYFDISLTIPNEFKAISNSDILTTKISADNKLKTVTFGKSPYISTYLITLAFGKFISVEGKTENNIPIRVHTIAEMDEALLKEDLLRIKEIIPILEKKMGFAYPYKKLDYIYFPDYGSGALESAAAIQSRDGLLLNWSTLPSSAKFVHKKVLLHEIAHQWFGNEVTMSFWDDIWLNESFASWVEQLAPNDDNNVNIVRAFEQDFAFKRDSIENTHPIKSKYSIPENEGMENFDPIIYQKGAVVIEMVSNYVGKEVFWKGVQKYLLKYRKQNTTSKMFWEIIDEVSQKNISGIVANWFEKPGYPLLTVDAKCENDKTTVVFSQERMFLKQPQTYDETIWNIPIYFKTAKQSNNQNNNENVEFDSFLLKDKSATKSFSGCRWIYPNVDTKGFYRINLTSSAWNLIKPNLSKLSSLERVALNLGSYNSALGSYTSFSNFLNVQESFYNDTDTDVAMFFLNQTRAIEKYFSSEDSNRKGWVNFISNFSDRWVQKLGLKKLPEDSSSIAEMRDNLLSRIATTLPNHDVSNKSKSLLLDWIDKKIEYPNEFQRSLLPFALVNSDTDLYKKTVTLYNEMPENNPKKLFLLFSLMNSPHKEYIPEMYNICLKSKNKMIDSPVCMMALIKNPKLSSETWSWLKNNIQLVEKELSPEKELTFISMLGNICEENKFNDLNQMVSVFNREDGPFTLAKEKTINAIKTCLDIKKRLYPDLEAWLLSLDNKATK